MKPLLPHSTHHAILRLLAASSATADDLADALKLPVIVPAADLVNMYLTPMATAGLVRCAAQTWHVTEAGEHLAARMGPADIVRASASSAAPDDDDTGLTIHQRLAQATPCRPRRSLGTGQSRPPPMRSGSMDALALPSRRGNRLYFRDGKEQDA